MTLVSLSPLVYSTIWPILRLRLASSSWLRQAALSLGSPGLLEGASRDVRRSSMMFERAISGSAPRYGEESRRSETKG
ncbi:hypothetical protein BDV12DRAFT_10445 [Aspergillus spectabilis]